MLTPVEKLELRELLRAGGKDINDSDLDALSAIVERMRERFDNDDGPTIEALEEAQQASEKLIGKDDFQKVFGNLSDILRY